MRRTRNHRPTRKKKNKMLWTQRKKNAKQRKMKCMQRNLDQSRDGEIGVEHNRCRQM